MVKTLHSQYRGPIPGWGIRSLMPCSVAKKKKKKKKPLMKGAGKKKKQLEKEQTKPKLSRRKDVKEQRGIT